MKNLSLIVLMFPLVIAAQVDVNKKQDIKTVKIEKKKSELKSEKELKKEILKKTPPKSEEKNSNGKGVIVNVLNNSATETQIKHKK